MTRTLVFVLTAVLASSPVLAGPPANDTGVDPVAFRKSIENVRFDAAPESDAKIAELPATQGRTTMSKPWRAVWTAAAGFGGFYAGGVIGAKIEGGCNGCDDPGLKGALIGAPIGAAAAAITTWILSGK